MFIQIFSFSFQSFTKSELPSSPVSYIPVKPAVDMDGEMSSIQYLPVLYPSLLLVTPLGSCRIQTVSAADRCRRRGRMVRGHSRHGVTLGTSRLYRQEGAEQRSANCEM